MPDFKNISYETDGHVVTVTIKRPERRNALDHATHLELNEAWTRYEQDDQAWCAILTGEGDKAFCAGADLKVDEATLDQTYWMTFKPGGFGGLTERASMVKPVIAAVNGYALGGGFELALACDIIIAADHARFGLPEPRVGVFASDGGIHRLVRQIPQKIAMGLILTGRHMPADEAHKWGVANEVVPLADLMAAARRWADAILECSPLSLWASKESALAGLHLPINDAINKRSEYLMKLEASEDSKEGPRAFREKRKPKWTGR
ncbi:MAG: enoyl-CoA hydratase-related protein [Chloroflexota bacterium]|nr:enoyl-CoA hydratase-related protein [Chloroflexota bacterium]